MKILLMLFVLLVLTSCATISRPYDAVEYNYAVNIAVNSDHAAFRCTDKNPAEFQSFVKQINLDSATLVEFVSNKNDSDIMLPAARQVRQVVTSFLQRSSYSPAYCGLKIANIQASARMFARAAGDTDRFNVCAGDPKTRYVDFDTAHKAGKITDSEFKDLTTDLLALSKINTSGCTISNKVKLQDAINFIQTASGIVSIL